MTEQGNIFVSLLHKFANLGYDLVLFATAFAATHIRNNAVGTEIVAAVHHRNPRAVVACATNGQILDNGVFRFFGAIDTLTRFQLLREQLRQAVQGRRSHYEIYVRIAEFDIVLAVLLRHHTTANGNNKRGIFLLEVLVLPYNGERSFFGVLANGAGVDYNKVSISRILYNGISHLFAHSRKLFAVCLVLLTAKGLHKCAGTPSARFKNAVIFGTHCPNILLLLCRTKRRQGSVFLH